ncbi:MAG: hypothetical protein RL385_1477 [Pseudomonadota bacterium]
MDGLVAGLGWLLATSALAGAFSACGTDSRDQHAPEAGTVAEPADEAKSVAASMEGVTGDTAPNEADTQVDARDASQVSPVEEADSASPREAALPDAVSSGGFVPEVDGAEVCPKAGDTGCSFYRQAGALSFTYVAVDAQATGNYPLALKVKGSSAGMLRPVSGAYETIYEVESTPSLDAREVLLFDRMPPGRFLDAALPSEVVYDQGSQPFGCGMDDVAGVGRLSYLSLRTKAGALLVQESSAYVLANGVLDVVEAPNDPRPYDLRWSDADCAACGSRGRHVVAVEVVMRGETVPVLSVLPGEQKPLVLDGVEYVFRLSSADTHTDPRRCTMAAWEVYRKDLVTEAP